MLNSKKLLQRLTYLTLGLIFIEIFYRVGLLVQPGVYSNMLIIFSKNLLHSNVVLLQWLKYLAAQFLIYGLFILGIWFAALGIQIVFKLSEQHAEQAGIALWCFAWLYVFMTNQLWFPFSAYALLANTPKNIAIMQIIFWFGNLLFVALALIMLMALWIKLSPKLRLSFILLSLGLSLGLSSHKTSHAKNNILTQPNIIILGIDSLRQDIVDSPNAQQNIPAIKNFLNQTSQFNWAFTPLGRTFPAWVSILTGTNPKQNNARHTLIDYHRLNLQHNLALQLDALGYHTIFAIDERRFNDIDQAYGFKQIIGPNTGFNDFLLGTINDFPLSNLIINFKVGAWLFPFSHGNHAAYITYQPKTFNQMLLQQLPQQNDKPIFLALHFCLPHWPFLWANAPLFNKNNKLYNYEMYLSSLKMVDAQFADALKTLRFKGYLHNAIVVVMSDHGQSFIDPDENLLHEYTHQGQKIIPDLYKNLTDSYNGHGTSITELTQYHVVLAFRRFGTTSYKKTIFHVPASLIDIAPTILAAIQHKNASGVMQGQSLLPYLSGQTSVIQPRTLFMETGFTLPAILVAKKSILTMLQQGLNYIGLQPKTGLVEVRPLFTPLIIRGKQRALLCGHWLLIVYPYKKDFNVPIAVDLAKKVWTTDLNSTMIAHSPIVHMLAQLRQFYGTEIPRRLNSGTT